MLRISLQRFAQHDNAVQEMTANAMTWICCQLGAREHYAIPRALYRLGMLDYLLTDAWVPSSSLFNEGVGRVSGFATIQDTGESRLALTLLGDSASGDVPIISLTEAVERMGCEIDLLKRDCEGAEWDIFQEPRVFDRIRNIRLEYQLIQGHSVGDLERIITDLGFRIDRWIPNCSWLFACSTWRPKRTLREIVMDTAGWASRCEKELVALYPSA